MALKLQVIEKQPVNKYNYACKHVAIIMDGNRRWASNKSLIPRVGHRHGANKIEDLMDWCIELEAKSITLYAFSTENFLRSPKEVEEIMKLIEEKLRSILENERIHDNRIRVKAIGRIDMLPKSIQQVIQRVEEATKKYPELASAINKTIEDMRQKELPEILKKTTQH